jgi:DNA-directed RNA polymerase I subunit RPA43
MAPKRGPTAYFLFAEDYRATTREELLSEAGEGQKISVADVGKKLGDKWRNLTEEDKEKYKKIAQQKAEELKAQAADEDAPAQEDAEHGEPQQQQNAIALPIGTVKKIMMLDKDVSRASGDCVRTIALATEVFLGLLGSKCAQAAKTNKRRTIQLKDFEHAVRYDKRLVAAGLKEVVAIVQRQSEAAAANKPSKPAKAKTQEAAAAAAGEESKEEEKPAAADADGADAAEPPAADAMDTDEGAKSQEAAAGPASAPGADEGAADAAAGASDAAGSGSGKENDTSKSGSKAKPAKKAKASEPPPKNHSITTFFVRSSAAKQAAA